MSDDILVSYKRVGDGWVVLACSGNERLGGFWAFGNAVSTLSSLRQNTWGKDFEEGRFVLTHGSKVFSPLVQLESRDMAGGGAQRKVRTIFPSQDWFLVISFLISTTCQQWHQMLKPSRNSCTEPGCQSARVWSFLKAWLYQVGAKPLTNQTSWKIFGFRPQKIPQNSISWAPWKVIWPQMTENAKANWFSIIHEQHSF